MSIAVLGVPTSAGAYGIGLEQAPEALRAAGLTDLLRARGLDVVDHGDLPVTPFRPDPHGRRAQNLKTVHAVADGVREKVASLLADGHIPVVLGGDCTVTLGVVAAVAAAGDEVALAYLDGDVDMSTPATTTSGVLDAMVVAHLLDVEGCDPQLAGLAGRRPLLRGPDLLLIGFEDIAVDDGQRALLRDRGVHLKAAGDVRGQAGSAVRDGLARLAPANRLIVHFDVDVIDSTELPLAQFPHFNVGLALSEATECLAVLLAAPELAAVVVTEVNPINDPEHRYVPQLAAAIAATWPA